MSAINYQLSTINSSEIRPYATICDHNRPSPCMTGPRPAQYPTYKHPRSKMPTYMNAILQLQRLPGQLVSPKPGEGGSEPQLLAPQPGDGGSETSADPAETRSATTNRRRLGTVARLPYAVRHKLNLLM